VDILEELRRVIRLEAKALNHLEESLSSRFEEAVRMLQACQGKVILMGVGKSSLIANKIAATMVSTGTPAVFLHGSEGMHGDIGIVAKDDIVIAVGKSGESEELVALLPFIRRIGARIVSITAKVESTLARGSDLVLITPIEEEACPLNMAPTCSTTAALVLGDAIAMALMKLRNFQPDDFALFHPGGQLGKRLLLTVGDCMRRGEANPIIDLSQSIRIMLCEMTSKRAGAVSVVDDQSRLLGIITDFDIRRALEEGQDLFAMTIAEVDEKAVNALEFMEKREKPISVLPVLDRQDKVAGMIHLHDLISRGL
jgi:arabinose-5-phosphate isomerase